MTRDTCISSVGREKSGNCGGSWKLKLKGQQEFILFDIDPEKLKGRLITGALLYFNTSVPKNAYILRAGVSSVASPWEEGFLFGYIPLPGVSCFDQAQYKIKNWAYPGSTFLDVVFGHGHTQWSFANASRPDDDGWQRVAVDPDVVAARGAGLSYGFCVADEVGSEWRFQNQRFSYLVFPNRYVYSSEHFSKNPWIKIWINGEDHIPPDPVTGLEYEYEGLSPGQVIVKWTTPADNGGGKTLGFKAMYKKAGKVKEIPRYLIPMAGRVGETVSMYVQGLALPPGEKIDLIIRGVDSAGNESKDTRVEVKTAPLNQPFWGKVVNSDSNFNRKNVQDSGDVNYAIIDLLDKMNPESGRMISTKPKGYQRTNHLFDWAAKKISIQSARNETICFQINLKKEVGPADIKLIFRDFSELRTRIFKVGYVEMKDGKKTLRFPDPLVSLDDGFAPNVYNNRSFVCEVFVPHGVQPGKKYGKLSIGNENESIMFDVELEVYNFTLPDKLSFVPEMNAYGTVDPYKSYEYYKLAHEHRTCLNRLPYNWSGKPAFAPEIKDGEFNWEKWDERIGPLLDGSAFRDMKREYEPVDVFYLPFNENWPVNLFHHFKPSYWADEAFDKEYRETLIHSFKSFADHFYERRWFSPVFQFYLNNKITYRKKNKLSSAPWHFDEPVNTQDFWALRWYGMLWKNALVHLSDPRLKMWFRADLSYSQFGRNIFWGVTDMEYLGGNNLQKTRMIHERKILNGPVRFAEYGSANNIDESNLNTLLWCLHAWFKGADAVLPWQTIGTLNSWKTADQNAIFYPSPEGPAPSLRLKAFMVGQQLIEYCTIFSELFDVSRQELKHLYDKMIEANKGTVDPGLIWNFRNRLGKMISDQSPPYRRSWYNWEEYPLEKGKTVHVDYAAPSPGIKSARPDCDDFSPF